MRGSINYQVHELFKLIDHRGESKAAVKRQFYGAVRADKDKVTAGELKESERLKGTIGNLAERMGVYGNKTADDVRDTWHKLCIYVRDKTGVSGSKFDLTRVSTDDINSYCADKFSALDRRSAQNYSAHLLKLAQAIKIYNGEDRIEEIRAACRENLPEKSEKPIEIKNHINPLKVLDALKAQAERTGSDNAYKSYLASRVYYESGCRAAVARLITPTSKTQIDEAGIMAYKTKAGQEGSTRHGNQLSPETVRLIADYRAAHGGEFRLAKSTYNRWLHAAELAAGDRVLGAHSWRYDRAYIAYWDCRNSGMDHDTSLRYVAELLDHHRNDVVMHYLSRCAPPER
jgi:integrase